MLTQQQIIEALRNPQQASSLDLNALQEALQQNPYCEPLRWLWLKALVDGKDVRADEALLQSAVYISNRRWLYGLLYGEDEKRKPVELDILAPSAGDYFGTMAKDQQDTSLRELAQRLREARMAKKQAVLQETTESVAEVAEALKPEEKVVAELEKTVVNTEEEARKMLKEKRYFEALRILRSLIEENPEKSVYFAPQIKFIETIVSNLNN